MNIIKETIKTILLHTVFKLQYVYLYRKYRKNNKKQYILFGIPEHGNIGDHAIAIAERAFLKEIGIENVFEVPIKKQKVIIKKIKKDIKQNDIIMITGGGFIGDTWLEEENMVREVISTFKDNKIIIFPSTIYYRDNEKAKKELKKSLEIYNQHSNLVICAREKYTYDFIKENYKTVKALLIPDIVLYLYKKFDIGKEIKRKDVLFCLRRDIEKKVSKEQIKELEKYIESYQLNIDNTDTVINQKISMTERQGYFETKTQEFSKHKLVITDRLHGMIFAVITQTPCIAIGNYNYKVKGVYEWIKELDYIYFVDDIQMTKEKLNELLKLEDKINNVELDESYLDLRKELGG